MLGCAAFSSCSIRPLDLSSKPAFDSSSACQQPLDLSVPKWKVRQHWSGGSIVQEKLSDASSSPGDGCSCASQSPLSWFQPPRIEIHISQNFYPVQQPLVVPQLHQKRLCTQETSPPRKKTAHLDNIIGEKAHQRLALYVRSQVKKTTVAGEHVMEDDLSRLAATLQFLQNSGYYYSALSWQESVKLLQGTEVGTFLVRDSSDPRFLFSLSVQTERGAASVRIHYVDGSFRLDADARLSTVVPKFDSVSSMIDHYVAQWKTMREKGQVWLDGSGRMYSSVVLRKPLLRKCHSLQHMCRLTWNKMAPEDRNRWDSSGLLPHSLETYLSAYPFHN